MKDRQDKKSEIKILSILFIHVLFMYGELGHFLTGTSWMCIWSATAANRPSAVLRAVPQSVSPRFQRRVISSLVLNTAS